MMRLPFEHKSQPLLPFPLFLKRLLLSIGVGATIILLSLAAGMVGHQYFIGGTIPDSFLWASMLLSGMGPIVDETRPFTESAKVFSGCYALFSGFMVLVVVGVSLGPVIHRLLHRLHIDDLDYASLHESDTK